MPDELAAVLGGSDASQPRPASRCRLQQEGIHLGSTL